MVGYRPLFNVDDDGDVDVVESKLIAKDPPPSALRTQTLACFLTAQTRQIIRHVPLDVTGHGYRFIGFKLNSSAGWQSELVEWIVPDACIATCIEDIHTSCAEGLVLNATSFLQTLGDCTCLLSRPLPYFRPLRRRVATCDVQRGKGHELPQLFDLNQARGIRSPFTCTNICILPQMRSNLPEGRPKAGANDCN
jgi:hypothetical protein